MADGLSVIYGGDNSDIVLIRSQADSIAADTTADKLHEYKIADNGSMVAVHCGIVNGGDGVLLYGLYWRNFSGIGHEKVHCDGVLKFVPADGFLNLSEVISSGPKGAYIKIITGSKSDVYTQFYWDGATRKWYTITQYYDGWGDPKIAVPLGQTVRTTAGEDASAYTATYLHLRKPHEPKRYFPSWSNILDWKTFPFGKPRS